MKLSPTMQKALQDLAAGRGMDAVQPRTLAALYSRGLIDGAAELTNPKGREAAGLGRDGFVIRRQETGEEIDFVASTKGGSERERVELGLLMRVDAERFYFEDTRDAEGDTDA